MKTIFLAHNYSEDSFSAMSYYLAHHLAELGNTVVFISHRPFIKKQKNIKKTKGKMIICSWPTESRPTSIKDVIWFFKLYFKYKPDTIIGHFVGANITIGMSKLLSLGNVRTFGYYHTLTEQINLDVKKKYLKRKFLVIRKAIFYKLFCDAIICPSELAQKDLKNNFNFNKGVVFFNPMKDRFKNEKIQDQNAIVISYLGRFDNSKGILEFIEAFILYKEKNEFSKIVLNIAGTGKLDQKIKDLIVNEISIRFLGGLSYDKVDDYLSKSHFAVIPSKIDNLPTVGLEAMMNCTPLLITNSTGLSTYLEDNKDCFKFDSNLESMIFIFDKVENNFFKHKEMSENARKTFLTKFGLDNYCNSFSNIILR